MGILFFVLALFLGLHHIIASAAPIGKEANLEHWVVRGFHWNCAEDETTCVFGFTISENPAEDEASNSSFCHFVVHSQNNESTARTSFSDVPCEDLTQYHCAGGWGSDGFMVLTVDNVKENRRAYFGYGQAELENGQISSPHLSPAYFVGAASDAVLPSARSLFVRQKGDEVVADVDVETVLHANSSLGAEEMDSGESDGYDDSDDDDDDFSAAVFMVPGDGGNNAGEASGTEVFVDTAFEHPNEELIDSSDMGKVVAPANGQSDGPATELLNDSMKEPSQDIVNMPLGDDDDTNDDDINDDAITADVTNMSVPEDPVTWALRNVTRNVQYGPNAVDLDFLIDIFPFGPVGVSCSLHVDIDNTEDPMFSSWFVQPCQNSDWYMSWCYNPKSDSAVATLINPERTQEAWFGWNDVNSHLPSSDLSNVGPGVVQNCIC